VHQSGTEVVQDAGSRDSIPACASFHFIALPQTGMVSGLRITSGESCMRSTPTPTVFALVLGAMLWMLAPFAGADIIPTDQVPAQDQVQTEREKVQSFLDRSTVKEKLKALGVQDAFLKGRVDSLTDAEVHLLAQKIDALPAGGALTDFQIILIVVLVAILVALIV
jgi:uncharacterized protein DUF6627